MSSSSTASSIKSITSKNTFFVGNTKITKDNILTGYNYASNADFVFSEILPINFRNNLDVRNSIIVEETKNSILYFKKKFIIQDGDVVFCNPYLTNIFFEKIRNRVYLKKPHGAMVHSIF